MTTTGQQQRVFTASSAAFINYKMKNSPTHLLPCLIMTAAEVLGPFLRRQEQHERLADTVVGRNSQLESVIHFGRVPGFLGGPEMKSPGTAKSCWKGKKLVIDAVRKFQRRHLFRPRLLLFLLFLSSWDYFLCAKPTRDRRASEREARGGSGAILFESFAPSLHCW